MSVAGGDVLIAGQFLQTTWSTCMEFVGADTDFRSESEFSAVIESSTRVHHYSGAINSLSKVIR